MSTQTLPSPVAYPALRINGNEYQFRFTRTTRNFCSNRGATISRGGKRYHSLAWAASMAGTVDSRRGFTVRRDSRHPTEFTDQLALEDDHDADYEAVTEALKKVAPKATLTLVASPAGDSSSTERPPES